MIFDATEKPMGKTGTSQTKQAFETKGAHNRSWDLLPPFCTKTYSPAAVSASQNVFLLFFQFQVLEFSF